MNAPDERLHRLLRSAAAVGAEAPVEAPLGFDTRVIALLRQNIYQPNGLATLLRRVTLLSAVVLVISSVAAFREVRQSLDLDDASSNEFAIADAVIQNEFVP
jgi:hypothetical protein